MSETTETTIVHMAFRVALDLTPKQERAFSANAGAARFAYNWGIARLNEITDQRAAEQAAGQKPATPYPTAFDLMAQWRTWTRTTEWTDKRTGQTTTGVPWIKNHSVFIYQTSLRDAHTGMGNYFKSRTGQRKGEALGRPRFKKRGKSTDRFTLYQVRLLSPTRMKLPIIGPVTIMSDDSRHPAMAASRRRRPGQRHMGNRRRARTLHDRLLQGERLRGKVRTILAQAQERALHPDDDALLETLNSYADADARAEAVAKADERIATTETYIAELRRASADDPKRRAVLSKKTDKALERLERERQQRADAENTTANQKQRWSADKLHKARKTGEVVPQKARHLARAYRLDDHDRTILVEAAHQPRIVSTTFTRGADGLWWASMSCEIPHTPRTEPTPRQRRNGPVGVDTGTRQITLSKRPGRIDRHLRPESSQASEAIRRAHRTLSRRTPGSKRYAKARAHLGRLTAQASRERRDAIHRITTNLTRRHTAVGVENFDVRALTFQRRNDEPKRVRRAKNLRLSDAGIGELRAQLAYKAPRAGAKLHIADTYEQTARTCSACGQAKTTPPRPGQEWFSCDDCGLKIPRRINTAHLLEQAAASTGTPHGGSDKSRGGGVSPASLSGERAAFSESGSPLPPARMG